MSNRFLRFPQLKTEKGIPWTRIHIDRLEKTGSFPQRVKLGPATVAWSEDEIDAWSNGRCAARVLPTSA